MNNEDTLRRFGRVTSDWQDREVVSEYRRNQDAFADVAGSSGETLTGTDGADRLIGGRGDDIIEGGGGNDYLAGGAGRDTISGGAGDDYIADGWGTGSMDGGEGVDTVDVSHTNTGAVIDLVAGTVDWDGHSPTETAINFENVIGSQGNNTIIGTDGANRLEGRGGDDTLIGGGGNDTLYGGAGRSTYVYNLGDGSDVIFNGAGSTSETSDDGFSADPDWDGPRVGREGAAGQDHGQDSIVFGAGITAADVAISHVGADLILTLTDGETLTLKDYDIYPVEVLEFADGSTQDISSYQPQDWTGRRQTWFTSGRDNYFGGEGDDTLNGRSGHDQLHGGGGDDTLLGGSGNDGLFGGAGDDRIDGGSGRDTIYGDAGDDWISGGYGVDHMDGGAGNDTLDYGYSIENVDIDLAAGQSTFGSGETEITTNFENAIGSQGDNVITGTSGENTIDGGAGDDTIIGGAGNDRLKGGSGADIFEFSKGDGIDIIDDFDPAVDTLRINGAGNNSIIIEYLTIGTLITYGRDADGNPVDQIFLVGVASGLVTNDDIEKPDVEFIGTNDADVFDGTDAAEEISTHGGDDIINAGGGSDYIQAGDGDDEIHAGAGNDYVEGGLGADTAWLGTGNDIFVDEAESGPTGNDEVHGGAGDDRFYGAGGDDIFYGDEGSDTLNGGVGNDTFTGGSGADLIELDFGDGVDTMTDFEDGLDIIDLSETGLAFGDLTITDAADGVHLGLNKRVFEQLVRKKFIESRRKTQHGAWKFTQGNLDEFVRDALSKATPLQKPDSDIKTIAETARRLSCKSEHIFELLLTGNLKTVIRLKACDTLQSVGVSLNEVRDLTTISADLGYSRAGVAAMLRMKTEVVKRLIDVGILHEKLIRFSNHGRTSHVVTVQSVKTFETKFISLGKLAQHQNRMPGPLVMQLRAAKIFPHKDVHGVGISIDDVRYSICF